MSTGYSGSRVSSAKLLEGGRAAAQVHEQVGRALDRDPLAHRDRLGEEGTAPDQTEAPAQPDARAGYRTAAFGK